ncbi:hypothetical protein E4U53_005450 [Claviceps sorghi]|nr:hypothetical protein E4U53_005450 [Claviceps sorghi]
MGSVLDKNSSQVRKRIENHTFNDEDGDEYEGSAFGGFGDYFRRKKIKLQNLDADLRAASDKPQIFKGIVAHITGYTQPPLHVLHREIVQHGGGYLQYLDSKTMATHIIASTLPPKKSVDFNRYRIVKPAWIVESVAAGKLLPWGDYRVLDEGPRQKVLKFGGESGLSQAAPEPKRGYKEQTDNSFYNSQFRTGNTLPSQQWSQLAEEARTPTPPPTRRGASTSTSRQRTRNVVAAVSTSESGEALPGPSVTGFSGRENVAQNMPPAPGSPPVVEDEARPVTELPKTVTPEEHNAWLLSDPRLRKSSTANPEFLKQFYSESRLHHLSTWKANLKSSMQRMAAEKGLSQNKLKRKQGARRYIMYVDFDSFFCAVSLKQSPQYADKPAVVAHSAGPGSEIASCNYPARNFGVKNGMWMKRAVELCPDLKVLPYDFPAYEEASRLFYESILSVGGVVQSVSIDEALVDATSIILSASGSQGVGIDEGSIWREQQKADEIASGLRKDIKEKTGCDVSIGIGGNVLQARVALRKAKPAGQFQLKPEDVLAVIGELTVEQLPGVAYSIGGKLEELGVRFVKDIRGVSKEQLANTLGPKTGEKLADYARGIDRVEVGEQPPRKSVSAEVNWGIRFVSQPEAEEFVLNLCKELERRLVSEQVRGKHLTVKIMRRSLDAPLDPAKHLGHGKCDMFNKSATFGVATYSGEAIGKEAISMLRSFKFSPGDLRGLGVQMTKLEPIKAAAGGGPGQPEGSQRTLSFGPFAGPASARRSLSGGRVVEAIDEVESPEKPKKIAIRGLDEDDPIAEDPLTPRRPKTHPAMALSRASQDDAQAKTPLNVSGTQFIMPSNPDLAVMAELPYDIRKKLMMQQQRGGRGRGRGGPSSSPSPASGLLSRPESPERCEGIPSQIDPEVFNALPKDVQAEVLATYGRRPPRTPKRDHRPQVVGFQQRKQTTPTKRGGIRGMFGKAQRHRDAQAGVVQTRFRRADESLAAMEDIEELDPDFLAQLPDDVRNEVVTDHRRRRMALRSGLDAPNRKHHVSDMDGRAAAAAATAAATTTTTTTGPAGNGQHKIRFPGPPRKVPFSSSGVTSTPEIKDMIDAWHSETRDEGPHESDVAVLEKYLVRVVKEERDLEKVVVLVRWLDVLVERDGQPGRGGDSWRAAVRRVKAVVQSAVGERGIGPLDM